MAQLQQSAGNRAVAGLLSLGGNVFVQREKKRKPPAPSPRATAVKEQVEKKNVTAAGGALSILNGCNPQELLATIDQLDQRELLLYGAKQPHGFDGPRLATAFQASLSNRSAEGVAAIELLDAYRTYGSDVAGFWKHKVGPIPDWRLETLLRLYDRRVLDSFKAYLNEAPPAVAKRVGAMIGRLFDPPAKDITIEFRPDEFVVPETVTYPDGHLGPRILPLGVMIARVKGRVAAIITARGGPWERKVEPSGHRADPSQPGKFVLGGKAPVVTAHWKMSQIRWGAPLREVPGPSGTEVEFQTTGGAWQNTLKLKTPISRADIIAAEPAYGRPALVPPMWDLNDFGPRAYAITGTDQLVHTTPPNENEFSDKLEQKLQFSHGCIHIKPSERNLLEEMNVLKGGVTIVIRPYKRGSETYGAPL